MIKFRLFVLATILAGTMTILVTSQWLPVHMALHFAANGDADGYGSRAGYTALMVGLSLFMPVLIYLLSGLLPRLLRSLISLPNADYWLTPERLPATLDALERFGAVIGVGITLFLVVVHGAVIEANRHSPAHLNAVLFAGLLGIMIAMMLYLAIRFYRKFLRVPGKGRTP